MPDSSQVEYIDFISTTDFLAELVSYINREKTINYLSRHPSIAFLESLGYIVSVPPEEYTED